MSRTKPKIRDSMVMLLTTIVERNNRLFAMRTYYANLSINQLMLSINMLRLKKLSDYSIFMARINGLNTNGFLYPGLS